MPGLLAGDHFNAAIITNTTAEDDQFLSRTQLPYPVVLINRTIARYWGVIEDPQIGAEVASLLWDGRRRQLAVLHGNPLTQTTRNRVDSFMRSVYERMGRLPDEIVAGHLTEAAAYEATLRFLKRGGKVDGVYATTDGMALGAYHAIKKAGLSIPDDVAVVGVGDYEISPFFDPPLTTVGVHRSEIGLEASRLLLQQMEQPDLQPSQIVLPIETVLRASTSRK
jgi:LacI family transcriptional regulator